MGKSKKLTIEDLKCPHCDSELLVRLEKNEDTEEIDAKISVLTAGKKVIEKDEQDDSKKGGGFF